MQITKTGQEVTPPKILLYGVEGIGKTTFGADAPKALFMRTEEGLDYIEADAMPLVTSWNDVRDQVNFLKTEDHGYKTLVVDSVDWLERHLFDDVAKSQGKQHIEDIGYGKGFLTAAEQFQGLLNQFSRLHRDKKMSIILLAHAQIERFNDPAGESYDRYSPALAKKVSAVAREWADDVLFANFKTVKKTADKNGERRIAAMAERVIYASDRPSHIAKTRSGIPEEIDLSWESYITERKNARSK